MITHCISLHLVEVYLYAMGGQRLVISWQSNYRPSLMQLMCLTTRHNNIARKKWVILMDIQIDGQIIEERERQQTRTEEIMEEGRRLNTDNGDPGKDGVCDRQRKREKLEKQTQKSEGRQCD